MSYQRISVFLLGAWIMGSLFMIFVAIQNFAMADTIRKRLGELNITLEDRPGGTNWRLG